MNKYQISGVESVSFAPLTKRIKVRNKGNFFQRLFWHYENVVIPKDDCKYEKLT